MSMLDKLQTLSDQHETGLVPDFSIVEKIEFDQLQRVTKCQLRLTVRTTITQREFR